MRSLPCGLAALVACAAGPFPAGAARADPCADWADGLPDGAVHAWYRDADLGRARRTCGRSEIGLSGGALLDAQPENFYGNLSAGLTLSGSYSRGPGEVFGTVQALRYEAVLGPTGDGYVGLGDIGLGGSFRFVTTERLAAAVNGKLALSLPVGLYENAAVLGGDLGVSLLARLAPRVHLHAQAGGLGDVGLGGGPAGPRAGASVTVGADLRPAERFAVAVDLHGGFGHDAPLDVLAAGLALRFGDTQRFGFEVSALVPFAGREPALFTLELGATVRLGG